MSSPFLFKPSDFRQDLAVSANSVPVVKPKAAPVESSALKTSNRNNKSYTASHDAGEINIAPINLTDNWDESENSKISPQSAVSNLSNVTPTQPKTSRAANFKQRMSDVKKRSSGSAKSSAVSVEAAPTNVSIPENCSNVSFSSVSDIKSPESMNSSLSMSFTKAEAELMTPVATNKKSTAKSNQKSAPSGTRQKGPKPSIGLFWDIENCRVPALKSEMNYINAIRDRFCKDYICDEFICVCAVDSLSDRTCEELNNAQVTLAHVPSGAKNAADEKLRQKIRRFGELFSHKNAAAILITGDINFISDVTDLVHRCGVKVILIHNNHTNDQLKSIASETFLHEDILSSIPDRTAKPGMLYVKHELVVKNLPIHQPEMAIRARLNKLCDNCGGKILQVNMKTGFAFLAFSSPETCERAHIRLQNKDVLGNKIQVDVALRQSNYVNGPVLGAAPPMGGYSDGMRSYQGNHYQNFAAMQPPALQPIHVAGNNQMSHQVPMSNLHLFNNKPRSFSGSAPRMSYASPVYPSKGNAVSGFKRDVNSNSIPPAVGIKRITVPAKPKLPPPTKNIIKDSDVNAILVKASNDFDCTRNETKVRQILKRQLKSNQPQPIAYKTAFSTNPDSSSLFAMCFSSEVERDEAIRVISGFSGKDFSFSASKAILQDDELEDLKINVLALLDTTKTQLHTFIMNYWQKFDKFIKPSLLNYLIDELIVVDEPKNSPKVISLKSEDPELGNKVMTFEYLKAASSKSPEKLENDAKDFNPYDPMSFQMLQISDSPFKMDAAPLKFIANNMDDEYSNYILYLNYDPMPFHRCTNSAKNFTAEKFYFKKFSEQVYELVSEHGGFIPMSQFLNCYQTKFGKLLSENVISFEQLLLLVDGISTFMENSKCVCFSSLDIHYKEYFSDVRAPFPVPHSKMNEFITEVFRQLEMAESNNYKVKISDFLQNYYESKGRHFDSSRYGYQDPRELFSACRGYFTVLGVGTNQQITYSRRMNTKRFGSFLRSRLRSTDKDLVGAVRKLKFNSVHFGFYSNDDICQSSWLQLAISTQQQNNSTSANFDSVTTTVKDITNFSLKTFIIVSNSHNQTLSYREFLTRFQEQFGRSVKPSDFGFVDLKELLLATELVWITDSVDGSTQTIMFRPLIKLLHELVQIMRKMKSNVSLSELSQNYNWANQKSLVCYQYGFPTLTKLLESLPTFLSKYSYLLSWRSNYCKRVCLFLCKIFCLTVLTSRVTFTPLTFCVLRDLKFPLNHNFK